MEREDGDRGRERNREKGQHCQVSSPTNSRGTSLGMNYDVPRIRWKMLCLWNRWWCHSQLQHRSSTSQAAFSEPNQADCWIVFADLAPSSDLCYPGGSGLMLLLARSVPVPTLFRHTVVSREISTSISFLLYSKNKYTSTRCIVASLSTGYVSYFFNLKAGFVINCHTPRSNFASAMVESRPIDYLILVSVFAYRGLDFLVA
jgi:hypothetical protein